jgi:hypothetical protein
VRNIAKVAAIIVSITGLIQLVLGLLFWVGRAQTLISLHMVIGFLFVLSTWIIAGVGLRAGAGAMAAFTLAWGVVVIALGMTQAQLFPGAYHWIVRVAHLAVGVVAMALAGRLSRQIRDRWGTERKSPIPGTGNVHPRVKP